MTRRWWGGGGELDIVALDEDTIVFVEVKASLAPGFSPEANLGPIKRQRIASAAHAYLAEMGESEDRLCRVDLIAFDAEGMRHHRDVLAE